ncbi:helix-turn-helix domain-containing protein [Sodalis ligni]|nr:helix-turn-helix domain-containing protein [Sodalis ligni]
MITLNSKAQLTMDVIAKVAEHKITIANAAKLLNKSRRTIECYLQRYRDKGLQFVVHGNAGSEPANKTQDIWGQNQISTRYSSCKIRKRR